MRASREWWDWDDDSLLTRADDYTDAEIQRMDVARLRREPVPSPCDQSIEDNREDGVS